MGKAIHWINLYLVDNAIGFANTYSLGIQRLNNWDQVNLKFILHTEMLKAVNSFLLNLNNICYSLVNNDYCLIWQIQPTFSSHSGSPERHQSTLAPKVC